jgi:HD-like signal output (HDOD) protein
MPIHPELQDKIGKLTNLPTLPSVASYLLQAVNDPDTSAGDIGRVVAQDASLSAKIIRLANSAYYGIPRSITNVNNAVVILGFKVINVVVLSLTVFDMFPRNGRRPAFDRRQFWRHCLTSGVLSRLLAQKAAPPGINAEDAFCAGILHDIGKIVMEQYLHGDLQRCLSLSADAGVSFIAAEQELLHFTHADVAEWLIDGWDLPDSLHFPIISHHDPLRAEACREYACLCHCGDVCSYDAGLDTDGAPQPAPSLIPEAAAAIGVTPDHFDQALAEAPAALESMSAFTDMITS